MAVIQLDSMHHSCKYSMHITILQKEFNVGIKKKRHACLLVLCGVPGATRGALGARSGWLPCEWRCSPATSFPNTLAPPCACAPAVNTPKACAETGVPPSTALFQGFRWHRSVPPAWCWYGSAWLRRKQLLHGEALCAAGRACCDKLAPQLHANSAGDTGPCQPGGNCGGPIVGRA